MRSLLIGCALGAAACGGGPSAPVDLGTADLSLTGELCVDPRADAWQLPITKTSKSGAYTVALVASDASPPIIGLNRWTLAVTTKDGSAAPGLPLYAKPWMPDHHHGTSVIPTITSQSDAYTIENLYFFMAGTWQTTITLDGAIDAGAGDDDVQLTFCLSDQ